MFNKKIHRLKLSITTKCNLNCRYCFVNKTSEDMELETAKRAVDLLLAAKPKEKLLSIYGGEPLLNFGLIKMIVPYAFTQADYLKKKLTIECCTNGTLIESEHLFFFKKYNIRLHISMAGKRDHHDKFRNFSRNRGTYDLILRNLRMVHGNIPVENLGLSFCILPGLAGEMEQDFHHLSGLGFGLINLEIIQGFSNWSKNRILYFALNLTKIIKNIIDEIPEGNFKFLNLICRELKYKYISNTINHSVVCPFEFSLEVYPGGEMAFSPFLLNHPMRNRFIIGNVNKGIMKRYSVCKHGSSNNACKLCLVEYFRGYNSDKMAGMVQRYCYSLCLDAASFIQKKAKNDKLYSNYIDAAKQRAG